MITVQTRFYAKAKRCCLVIILAVLSWETVWAQPVSDGISYEQTEPAQWDRGVTPENRPETTRPALDSHASANSAESRIDPTNDYYDTLEYYDEDYPIDSQKVGDATSGHREAVPVNTANKETQSGEIFVCNYIGYGLMAVGVLILGIFLLHCRAKRRSAFVNAAIVPEMGRVIGCLRLNQLSTLYYVQIVEQVLIVGVTGDNVTLVAKFPARTLQPPQEEDSRVNQQEHAATASNHELFSVDLQGLRNDIQEVQHALKELREHHLREDGTL